MRKCILLYREETVEEGYDHEILVMDSEGKDFRMHYEELSNTITVEFLYQNGDPLWAGFKEHITKANYKAVMNNLKDKLIKFMYTEDCPEWRELHLNQLVKVLAEKANKDIEEYKKKEV